jgi:hypothetical protein
MTREDAIMYAQQTANYTGQTYYAVKIHPGRSGWSFGIHVLKSYLDHVKVPPCAIAPSIVSA